MPEIIRISSRAADGAPGIEADAWTWLDAPGTPIAPSPGDGTARRIVVSLAAWKARRDALVALAIPLGVWLGPADDPAELAPDLPLLSLVAVHFPKFADGRGYSTAALLRTRYGFEDELRAFGDVGRDQLFNLRRCGFDAFALAPHRDPRAALASLADFTVRYQGSVDDPEPLFRKRFVTAATR